MNHFSRSPISRRKFLGRAAAGAALFQILPNQVLEGAEPLSPNEKLTIAGIGVGGQGGSDISGMSREGQNIVALCDVDDHYAAKKFAQFPKAKRFKDFRVMLDEMGKEIDAVVVGTPDHDHAVITMEVMRHGKPVYCEKPLAHSIHEVRRLMAAAHQYKVVTQLGNQGHSFGSIRQVCEWVWAGAIGKVQTDSQTCRRSIPKFPT